MRKILFFVFWKPEFNKDTELFSQIEDSGKKLNTVLFLFMENNTGEYNVFMNIRKDMIDHAQQAL